MSSALTLLLAPWVTIILVSTISAWRYGWGLPRPELPGHTPPTAVIVAVKGVSPTTTAFFEKLLDQAYPDFRIIAAVESHDDPAAALIKTFAAKTQGQVKLVVAGRVTHGGQKVANLLAALDSLETRDKIVVFTDADTLPHTAWLGRCVSALVDAGFEAVSGYRWMVPVDDRLASAFVAAANTSIVTMPRAPVANNLCWGGTMALRVETLERIAIRRYWTGAISDDLQMTRALNDHKIQIYSPRQSLLLSPVSFDWRGAFEFGVRQHRLLFLHFPWLWAFSALLLSIPLLSAGLAFSFALKGDAGAAAVLLLAIVSGEIRFRCRRQVAGALFGPSKAGYEALTGRVDRWMRPFWWGFHAACGLAAPFSRRIHWAGVEYHIEAPQKVRAERRPLQQG
jgi:hypothetical protein